MLRLRFTQEADTVLKYVEDGIEKVVTLAKDKWFHLPDVGAVKQLVDKGHLTTESVVKDVEEAAIRVVDESKTDVAEVKIEETEVVAQVIPEVIAPVVEEVKEVAIALVKPFEYLERAGKQKWEL